MNRYFILSILTLLVFSTISMAQVPKKGKNAQQTVPALQWTRTSFDMGKIPQGKPASATFEFTNAGKIPLVIKMVQPSCGCTSAGYTRAPVNSGQTGFVKATYDAVNYGKFSKTLTVKTDDNETAVLVIHGEVVEKMEIPKVK